MLSCSSAGGFAEYAYSTNDCNTTSLWYVNRQKVGQCVNREGASFVVFCSGQESSSGNATLQVNMPVGNPDFSLPISTLPDFCDLEYGCGPERMTTFRYHANDSTCSGPPYDAAPSEKISICQRDDTIVPRASISVIVENAFTTTHFSANCSIFTSSYASISYVMNRCIPSADGEGYLKFVGPSAGAPQPNPTQPSPALAPLTSPSNSILSSVFFDPYQCFFCSCTFSLSDSYRFVILCLRRVSVGGKERKPEIFFLKWISPGLYAIKERFIRCNHIKLWNHTCLKMFGSVLRALWDLGGLEAFRLSKRHLSIHSCAALWFKGIHVVYTACYY